MIDEYIYMIIIDGLVWPEYGYFNNFDDAKSKAANIAAEYGVGKVNEESWKSARLFVTSDHVIGVIKIDNSSVAEM